jgi:hypothetical protein
MGEHVVALKAFYATLTPVQQKTFEDFHMSPRNGLRSKSDPASPKVEKAPAASKP